jgi:ATP-binding cassette subfamily B protein
MLLARATRMPARSEEVGPAPPLRDAESLAVWLEAASLRLGIEMNELRARAEDTVPILARAAPAVLRIGQGEYAGVLALLHAEPRAAVLIAPGSEHVRVPMRAIVDAMRGDVGADVSQRVDRLLDRVGVEGQRRAGAREALLDRMLGGRHLVLGWSLELPPSASFARQLRDAGAVSGALATLAMLLAQQALGIAGWWLIGRGALEGQIAHGWLWAWALVMVSVVPVQVVASWAQGTTTLAFAMRLKRRLLHGALHLAPDEVRHQGSGQLLGRVIESSALESLVANGGLTALPAIAEIVVAATVLVLAPGGVVVALAFMAWVTASIVLSLRAGRQVAGWTGARLEMTQNLVERMLGHRTRLAQEPSERWHAPEDEQLARYADRSSSLDRVSAWLQGALPRGWMVVGIAALAPSFVRGTTTGAELAVAIGGLVLGYRAFAHFGTSAAALLRARAAWEQTRPLFEAGARQQRGGSPAWAALRPVSTGADLLEMRNVHFRYAGRHEPVLRGVNLRIGPRDRLLVEGHSGGGKSTLGALLTGLRAPDAGLVLVGGLDRQTVGDPGWRRRVVAAPQFHENHLIGAPLAFNLLMGGQWPPSNEDLKRAQEVCEDLGLGPLIERMPGGLMQMVGETGWQLSHGERSRVFIARALLQNAEVVVLDESFDALDPMTLERAMRGVQKRAPALVVIAHP